MSTPWLFSGHALISGTPHSEGVILHSKKLELVLGVQFRHELHLECELTLEKMRGKAGSILEQALVHPITEHWRATF
jgi:hypothetical protein